jgi:3-dehydroquinate synthase
VNANQQIIGVGLKERSYPIIVGCGLLQQLDPLIETHAGTGPRYIAIDETLQGILNSRAGAPRCGALKSHETYVVPSGESSKSMEQAGDLWGFLAGNDAGRDAILIAIGGGVTGDLAGFVAATYARGISLIQVPTTLLAQVDSSVGGKVGINLPQGKNLVGAFWQPRLVVADVDMLRTLPANEIAAGMAEVVKYGVIADPDFFAFLEQHIPSILQADPEVMTQIVARCCQIKAQVVGEDERELTGTRAILNYGHTFAHAFEATLGYGILLHGEAVAIGMDCAARLARRLGMIDDDLVTRQRELLTALHLPTNLPVDSPSSDMLLSFMRRDKKAVSGRLRFILPTSLGKVEFISGIDEALVAEILEERI